MKSFMIFVVLFLMTSFVTGCKDNEVGTTGPDGGLSSPTFSQFSSGYNLSVTKVMPQSDAGLSYVVVRTEDGLYFGGVAKAGENLKLGDKVMAQKFQCQFNFHSHTNLLLFSRFKNPEPNPGF